MLSNESPIAVDAASSSSPPSAVAFGRWFDDPFSGILLIALVIGLAWAPFWLGGNRPFAWGVNGLLFPGLALVYEARTLLAGTRHPIGLRRLAWPASLFGVALAWTVIQTWTFLPQSFVHPIWGVAAESLARPLEASISVNRGASTLEFAKLLTCASAFWLSAQLSRNSARAHLLLFAIVIIVAAYSAYGLMLTAFFGGAIPYFATPYEPGLVRSTFVNRNSFATYAGLGLVVGVGLILRSYRAEVLERSGKGAKGVLRLAQTSGLRGWLLIGAEVATLAALLGAASRGGALATGAGLATLFMLVLMRRHRGPGQGAAMTLLAAALVVGFVAFADVLLDRLAKGGLGDVSRLSVDIVVIRSILDNPLLGVGLGAFADVFPLYRDGSIPTIGVWDKAHNSYLEVWQGLGLLFGTALMGALALLVAKCAAGALARRRDSTPPLVASAASVLIAVHALVDFSLQMEAIGLTFMAILGAGVAQSESRRRSMGD